MGHFISPTYSLTFSVVSFHLHLWIVNRLSLLKLLSHQGETYLPDCVEKAAKTSHRKIALLSTLKKTGKGTFYGRHWLGFLLRQLDSFQDKKIKEQTPYL